MIADDLAQGLPELQQHAESMMLDTLLIEELGEPVFDPGTGTTTRPKTTVYQGPGQLRSALAPEDADLAGDAAVIQRFEGGLPITVQGVKVGHRVTVTTSADPRQDPALIGNPLFIRSVGHGTWNIKRRFTATEQQLEA